MLSNSFVVIMIIIILILALAIMLLANVLLGAAQIPAPEPPAPEETEPTYAGGIARTAGADAPVPAALVVLLSVALLLSGPGYAKGPADNQATPSTLSISSAVNGVSDTAFYMITGVVLLEVIILLTLLYNVKLLLSIHKKRLAEATAAAAPDAATRPVKPHVSWWDKLNRFKPVEQEVDLDLGHDYDGIRELDNKLPPWWLYGFYCTIIFSVIYLWRFHVSHTAPSSEQEFQISMQQAELRKAEYLKKAANNIDENSVKLLTGEGDLAAGKAVFQTTCWACHGKAGEGGVGPNLTDEYWLHGGGIKDIFKTIKYGWPDKGMKSWKDDYSPSQIAEISSYVRSLQGTHPANPKAPQGVAEK